MILAASPQRVPTLSCAFWEKFGRTGKGSFTEKLESLKEYPKVEVQVLVFNMNLFSSLQRVPRPSYTFREKFERSGKVSFTEKVNIVVRGSICCAPERKGSELQYKPFLCSVACSQTELSISGNFMGDQVKDRSPKKLKSLIEVPYVAHLKVQVLIFNMNLIISPQRVPRPVIHFGKNLGHYLMGRLPKKLKSVIEVPYVAQLKIQVLILNMNLFYSPQRVS